MTSTKSPPAGALAPPSSSLSPSSGSLATTPATSFGACSLFAPRRRALRHDSGRCSLNPHSGSLDAERSLVISFHECGLALLAAVCDWALVRRVLAAPGVRKDLSPCARSENPRRIPTRLRTMPRRLRSWLNRPKSRGVAVSSVNVVSWRKLHATRTPTP